jgi:hypothetical protein
MTPKEVIATLIKAKQLVVRGPWGDDAAFGPPGLRAAIICPRTGQEITLANVDRVQVEHWPISHEHGGRVSPDNAVISLAEGHMIQTKKESQGRGKERRLQIARRAKTEIEKPIGKKPRWRIKKKLDGSVVKVRTR